MIPELFNIKKYTYLKFDWQGFLIALVTGGVATKLIEATKWLTRKRKKTEPAQNLFKLNDVYMKCMKPVLDNTKMDRFTIFKVHDGGGPLMPGAQYYMTCLHEDYSKPLHSSFDDYQRFPLDKSLTNLFFNVTKNGSAVIETKDVEEDTLLFAIMNKRDMLNQQFYFIAQTSNAMFFAGISTTILPFAMIEPSEQSEIYMAINRLRALFGDSVKYL